MENEGDSWRNAFVPVVLGVGEAQGKALATTFGLTFNVDQWRSGEWLDTYTLQFAQDINQTTKDTLKEVFQQAQVEGWSIGQMQSNINVLFDQWMHGGKTAEDFTWYTARMPAHRTEMIARTETLRSSNAGAMGLYREWGAQQKQWLATNDDRTRDAHWSVNGQTVGIDAQFDVGGEKLDYPGDPSGSPENTINCRCTSIPILE